MPEKRGLGWIPDLPDARDHICTITPARGLPPSVDMRSRFPACYDQGEVGSCTGNALAGCMEFDQIKEALKYEFTPARLFLYYNGRALEGNTGQDAGAQIRDVVKAANQYGAPPESDWPYDPSQVTVKPTVLAYKDGKLHGLLKYSRLMVSPQQIKTVLAQGFPITFGFTVYDSFLTDSVASSGIMPMPDLNNESVQGGHAVAFAGYQDQPWTDPVTNKHMPGGVFIVRNSWGTSWGIKGYFLMPYNYVVPQFCADFWQISTVK